MMLALFPDSPLCPDKERKGRLKIACPSGQVKTTSLYLLKILCMQQQVMSLDFLTLCFILHFMYNMHNTRPHPQEYTPPCK